MTFSSLSNCGRLAASLLIRDEGRHRHGDLLLLLLPFIDKNSARLYRGGKQKKIIKQQLQHPLLYCVRDVYAFIYIPINSRSIVLCTVFLFFRRVYYIFFFRNEKKPGEKGHFYIIIMSTKKKKKKNARYKNTRNGDGKFDGCALAPTPGPRTTTTRVRDAGKQNARRRRRPSAAPAAEVSGSTDKENINRKTPPSPYASNRII